MSSRRLRETYPIAPLKIIALDGYEAIAKQIDQQIVNTRKEMLEDKKDFPFYLGYEKETYLADYQIPRFGSGEAKAVINETIRGCDLFIIADVMNYSSEYKLSGNTTIKSPDDHFQDIKRIVAAAQISKVARINVILPFLYESRQHRRSTLESLDCANALQELSEMGVENIITFDAHDPRVQNAIPIRGFDNFYTSYQFMQELVSTEPNLRIDKDHFMVISPDEGGMSRAVYYANVLGILMGMFYKRRDYTTIVDGRNPIIAHEFLGDSVDGKDVFIIDDMISSGESILEVAKELKKRHAKRIFLAATFGLFCNGSAAFDAAYKEGIFDRIYTTNLVFTPEEIMSKEYYHSVDLSRYLALIINTLNHDTSVNDIIDPIKLIHEKIMKKN